MGWEAEDVLRRHLIERRRRRVTHSANLDGDPQPRMNDAQFADSCLMVQGIPEATLAFLEIWVCDQAGTTWTVDAVPMGGRLVNVPIQQVAMKLTLRQAAWKAGLDLTFQEARRLYSAAKFIVSDHILQRVERGQED